MSLDEATQEIARLKELLEQQQAQAREFRTEIYSDPEFKMIFERRQRERSQQRAENYTQKLLREIADQKLELELRDEMPVIDCGVVGDIDVQT